MTTVHHRRLQRTSTKIPPIILGLGLLMIGIILYAYLTHEFPYGDRVKILHFSTAILAAIFTYVIGGEALLKLKSMKTPIGEVSGAATGSMAVFVIVLAWWWLSPPLPSPEAVAKDAKSAQKKISDSAARSAESAYWDRLIDMYSESTPAAVGRGPSMEETKPPAPPPSASKAASNIPNIADPYPLAIKAIAEGDYARAEDMLNKAEASGSVSMDKITLARSQIAFYKGDYEKAGRLLDQIQPASSTDEKDLQNLKQQVEAMKTAAYLASR